MQASIFIARLLGPMFLVVSVAWLLKPQMFRAVLTQFVGSEVWLYFGGVLGLLAGLALVLTNNVWLLDWRLIITLLGWVMVVRALITIFQPQWMVTVAKSIVAHRGIFIGSAVFNLLIGLVLSYFGYAT